MAPAAELDPATSLQVVQLRGVIDSAMADAAQHLAEFERLEGGGETPDRETMMRQGNAVYARMLALCGGILPLSSHQSVSLYQQACAEMAREGSPDLPAMEALRPRGMHARGFVVALARVERTLSALVKLDTLGAKQVVVNGRDGLRRTLPQLTQLRDSIEHAENRARGLDRKGNPLELRNAGSVPAGEHMLSGTSVDGGSYGDSLQGCVYFATVEDGSEASIEVSDATLASVRAAVTAAFSAL